MCLLKLRLKIADRRRLVEQAAPEQSVLSLVSAPAGYGKNHTGVDPAIWRDDAFNYCGPPYCQTEGERVSQGGNFAMSLE